MKLRTYIYMYSKKYIYQLYYTDIDEFGPKYKVVKQLPALTTICVKMVFIVYIALAPRPSTRPPNSRSIVGYTNFS